MTAIHAGTQESLLRELARIPPEYHSMLLRMVQTFREGVTLKTAEASFRQGWQEAQAGVTFPVEELWDGIDAD